MPITRKKFPACPIERTLAVLSGRWKAMLVWHLFSGPRRYSELAQLMPDIAQRVLSQALGELQKDGVICKKGEQWQLTELGSGLVVALKGMYEWGTLHASVLPER